MTPFTFNAGWVSEVREALRELADATATDMPAAGALDRYLVKLYRATGGEASSSAVVQACAVVGREWREPSFPPPGAIARAMPRAADAPAQASPWPARRPWRRHTAAGGTSPRAYTPDQLAAAQAVRDAFWARHGRRPGTTTRHERRTREGGQE